MESNEENPLPSFRVLPDTCTELFFNYRQPALATIPGKVSNEVNNSIAVFRLNQYMDVQMHAGSGCLAICFQPGMVHHFFSIPMNELTNQVVKIEDLWNDAAKQLQEQVCTAPDNATRVVLLTQFLFKQFTIHNSLPDQRMPYCLQQINLQKGRLTVKEIAHHANLGERQLNRHFNDCFGLSPKEYAGVSKFIHSLPYLKKYPTLSLTDIAHISGYYDQSHFIHDYQKYSGFAPRELVSLSNILYC